MFMGIWARVFLLLGCLTFHPARGCENIVSIQQTLVSKAQAFFNAHKDRFMQAAQQHKCSVKVAVLLDDLMRVHDNSGHDEHSVQSLELTTARILEQLHTYCATQDGGELIPLCGQMRFANRVRLYSARYACYVNKLLERLDRIAEWMTYWYAQGDSAYVVYVLSQPVRNWCLPRNKAQYIENKLTLLKQMQRTCRIRLGILLERMTAHAKSCASFGSNVTEDALCVMSAQDMHAAMVSIMYADASNRYVEPPSFVGRYWPAVLISSAASIIGVRIGYLQQEKVMQALHNAYVNAHKHFRAGCVEPGKAMTKAWFDDHSEPLKAYQERKKSFVDSAVAHLDEVYGPLDNAQKQAIRERMMRDDITDLLGDSSKPMAESESLFKWFKRCGKQVLHASEFVRLIREYGVLCKMQLDCGMKPSKDMMLAMGPAMPWWSTVGGAGAVGAAAYAYAIRDTTSHQMSLVFKQYYDACVEYPMGSDAYYEAYATRMHAMYTLKSLVYSCDRQSADLCITDLEKLGVIEDMGAKRDHAQCMLLWYPFLNSGVHK
jgi:hypothetical protein